MAPAGRAALRDLRSQRGLSLAQLGRAAGYTRSYLWDLETGRRSAGVDLARRLDQALSGDGRLAAVLAVPPTPPTQVSAVPLHPDDEGAIRAAVDHLIGLDTVAGGDAIHEAAARLWRDWHTRLSVTPGAAANLRSAVAELGQVAAWLAHDAARDDQARTLLEAAWVDAEVAQAPIRWLCLDQLSMLAQWCGQPGDALALADRGVATAPPGVVAGLFHLRRARSLADLGAGAESQTAMRRARDLIGAGPGADDPPWAWWATQPEIDLHMASAASMLGEHHRAVSLAAGAVADLPVRQVRDKTAFAVRLMWMQARARDWRGAVDTAGVVGALPSGRVRGMVADTRRIATGAPRAALDALDGLG